MTKEEAQSIKCTMDSFRSLGMNVHGAIDVVDDRNFKRVKMICDALPTQVCKNCKKNADNGGVYPDGRTMCPIQEHYTLLEDGFCHLFDGGL